MLVPTTNGDGASIRNTLLPFAVPPDTGTKLPLVNSAAWSQSVERVHAPAALT